MISRKMTFLSAAVAVAALIATVAVAHTVHTHAVPANQASSGKVIGTAPDQATPPRRHGIIVCSMAIDSDCEKIETLLPM
jgi:methionine-rich copper-binding protein CopC